VSSTGAVLKTSDMIENVLALVDLPELKTSIKFICANSGRSSDS